MNLRAATACLILAAPAAHLRVQLPAPRNAQQASQPPHLAAHSNLVLVPALVRTRSGNLVFTLTANDFLLTDDGVPQHLTLERDTEQDTAAQPLALVLAIETGAAGARQLDKLTALAPMLDSVIGNVPHKIAVVAFDSHPSLLQDFTPSTDATAATLHHLPTGDDGAAILDTLGFSVDLLRKQPPAYRRAILLISETVDRGSHLQLEDAVRTLSDTNTAIYSIAFSTAKSAAAHYTSAELPTQYVTRNGGGFGLLNPYPYPPNGCMGKDPDLAPRTTKTSPAYDCLAQLAPPLALARLAFIAATNGLRRNIPATVANLTGGEYFKLTDAKSLERSLVSISNHIPNRYVLSFQPQSPHPGLHVIGLHLRDGSPLRVTARSSYWADPELTSPAQPSSSR